MGSLGDSCPQCGVVRPIYDSLTEDKKKECAKYLAEVLITAIRSEDGTR